MKETASQPAFWVGTSGYNYPEWKGSFYPSDLSAAKMLPYYAARFNTVEINATFYRMPSENALQGWAKATPDRFKLTLKAPRRITHDSKLRDCRDAVERFCYLASTVDQKLGVLLFQLPPTLKQDLALLDDFLAWLPPGVKAALEFRHASWLDDAVYERLKARNLALCVADGEKVSTPIMATASYAYFRLRDEGYAEADIARWAETIQQQCSRCSDIFVYFKHEDEGKGPQFAQQFMERLAAPA